MRQVMTQMDGLTFGDVKVAAWEQKISRAEFIRRACRLSLTLGPIPDGTVVKIHRPGAAEIDVVTIGAIGYGEGEPMAGAVR